MFPQFEFQRFTPLFISLYFFSVSEPKDDICENVLIENQLFIKTNQLTDS